MTETSRVLNEVNLNARAGPTGWKASRLAYKHHASYSSFEISQFIKSLLRQLLFSGQVGQINRSKRLARNITLTVFHVTRA